MKRSNLFRLKTCAIIGLSFLVINQIMLLGGNEFIQTQQPIDYAHWLLFIGVLLSLSINQILSGSYFSNTASIITAIGVVALLGQAVIDFLWWSYGTDYEGMNTLTDQIMNNPSIRIPFMTIGPAFFYLGLAIHVFKYFRKQFFGSIITIVGVIITGVGSFVFDSRQAIVLGHIVMSTGIIYLLIKIDTTKNKSIENVAQQ